MRCTRFSRHALQRMNEREITMSEVFQTIHTCPHKSIFDDEWLAESIRSNGRHLLVIFSESDQFKVNTVIDTFYD